MGPAIPARQQSIGPPLGQVPGHRQLLVRPSHAVFYSAARMTRPGCCLHPSRWRTCVRAAVIAAAGGGALLLPELANAQQQTFHLDRLEIPGAPDDGVVLFRPVAQPEAIFYG